MVPGEMVPGLFPAVSTPSSQWERLQPRPALHRRPGCSHFLSRLKPLPQKRADTVAGGGLTSIHTLRFQVQ